MTRRRFLRNTTALAAVSALCGARTLRAGVRYEPGTVLLRFPPNFSGSSLLARETYAEVWPGELTDVWCYGDHYPAPTIHLRKGGSFRVALENELEQETTMHLHGLILPPAADGQPTEAVAPDASYLYEFEVVNRAGHYFYHPHPHGHTGEQVYRGMTGMVIVTDDESEALSLPRAYYDLPLLIQDRASESHAFDYAPMPVQVLNGMLGDAVLVNGTPDAYALVDAGSYRLRIANGSNARIYKLGFSDGRRFHVIGTDGGLLGVPVAATSVFLGPGERVDLIVNFLDLLEAGTATLMTLHFGIASTPAQQGFEMPVLTFVGTGFEGYTGSVPAVLSDFRRYDPSQAVGTRRFELQTMPIAMGGHYHRINGMTYEPGRIDWRVRMHDLEIWELVNTHSMPHPIHIHGVQFQVLDRGGNSELAPEDSGWKDTVTVWGNETVRIMIRFDHFDGTYLLHCHNLEHEDEGMMLTFAVDRSTDVRSDALPFRLDLR